MGLFAIAIAAGSILFWAGVAWLFGAEPMSVRFKFCLVLAAVVLLVSAYYSLEAREFVVALVVIVLA